jgi:hypothetical protein
MVAFKRGVSPARHGTFFGSVFGQFSLAAIFLKPSSKLVPRRSLEHYAGTNLPRRPSSFVIKNAPPSRAIIDQTMV